AIVLNALPQSELRDELLSNIASGAAVAGVAWQSDSNHLTHNEDGDDVVLNGERQWVYPARADGWLIVSDDDAIYWLPANSGNAVVTPHVRVDGSLSATMRFENTRIARRQRLAQGSAVNAAMSQ